MYDFPEPMPLTDRVRSYLRGDDTEWVCESIAIAREVATRSVPDTPDQYDEVERTVLATLTNPQMLYSVVLSRNEHEAEEALVDAIYLAEASSVTVPDPDHDHVEYRGEVRPRREWRKRGIRTRSLPVVTAGYSVEDVVFSRPELELAVRTVCNKATAPQATPALIRLDVIDPALYQALAAHPELLRSLDWRVFEKLLADILEKFGYVVELQRGSKDGGIDLFAMRRSGVLGPERYILQAKRWTAPIGVEPVRQLLFLQSHHRATKACLATTTRFTAGAWQLAEQYQWQLTLRDFEGLAAWIAAVRPVT